MADQESPERKDLNVIEELGGQQSLQAKEEKAVSEDEPRRQQLTQELQSQANVKNAQTAARAVGGLELTKQMAEGTGVALQAAIEEDALSDIQRQQLQLVRQQLEDQLITQAQYEEYLRQMQMREMIRQRQLQQQQAALQLNEQLGNIAGAASSTATGVAATGGGLSALTMGFASNPIFAPIYFTGKIFKRLFKK